MLLKRIYSFVWEGRWIFSQQVGGSRDRCMSNSITFPYASVGFSRADFLGIYVDPPADLHESCLTIIIGVRTLSFNQSAYPTEISYLLRMLRHQILIPSFNLVYRKGPKVPLTYWIWLKHTLLPPIGSKIPSTLFFGLKMLLTYWIWLKATLLPPIEPKTTLSIFDPLVEGGYF